MPEIREHGPKSLDYPCMPLKEYTVGAWCPTPDGSGPPQAVAIEFKPAIPEFEDMSFVFRMRSRKAMNILIEILERYRDEVFPLNG